MFELSSICSHTSWKSLSPLSKACMARATAQGRSSVNFWYVLGSASASREGQSHRECMGACSPPRRRYHFTFQLKTELLLALHVHSTTLVNNDVAVSSRLAKIKRRVNKNVTAGSISLKQSKKLQQTWTEVPMLLSMVYNIVCIVVDQR